MPDPQPTATSTTVRVEGGYQSPSIILTEKDRPQNIINPGDFLQPNTPYDIYAVLNCIDFIAPDPTSGQITVRFWSFDGGLSLNGICLGKLTNVQLETLGNPFFPITTDKCSNTFMSAPSGMHKCIAVTISNFIYDGTNGFTCQEVTNPSAVPPPVNGCSAWRNTDSIVIPINKPNWNFQVSLGKFNPKFGEMDVELEVKTFYVSAKWNKSKKVLETKKLFRSAGVVSKVPNYLLPGLKETLEKPDLKIKMENAEFLKKAGGITNYLVRYKKNSKNSFEISGGLPKKVNNGDIILVNITAKYEGTKNMKPQSVEFLEVLHVKGDVSI